VRIKHEVFCIKMRLIVGSRFLSEEISVSRFEHFAAIRDELLRGGVKNVELNR